MSDSPHSCTAPTLLTGNNCAAHTSHHQYWGNAKFLAFLAGRKRRSGTLFHYTIVSQKRTTTRFFGEKLQKDKNQQNLVKLSKQGDWRPVQILTFEPSEIVRFDHLKHRFYKKFRGDWLNTATSNVCRQFRFALSTFDAATQQSINTLDTTSLQRVSTTQKHTSTNRHTDSSTHNTIFFTISFHKNGRLKHQQFEWQNCKFFVYCVKQIVWFESFLTIPPTRLFIRV